MAEPADDVGEFPHIFFHPRGMTSDPRLGRIRALVEGAGYELVDLQVTGTAGRPLLRVRADVPGAEPGRGITTEACAALSRAIERTLEAEGLVGSTYVLEVSSPGIERPVRFPEHWRRFAGQRVRVKARGLPGRPEAVIVGMPDAATVRLRLDGGEERDVALEAVKEATLVVDWSTIGRRPGGASGADPR